MVMLKFSIIVPVYNVEDYLDECVNSVVSQSYDNWELILVDDGSPDNCPQMCEEWANKDSRIKAVHKSNGGLSSARNAGIKHCTGDYILFLDSDDFYNDKKALETLASNLKDNEDVLVFGCTDFNMNTGKTIISRTGYDLQLIAEKDKIKSLHYLLSKKMIPGGACIFCTKSSLIRKYNICFKEGIQDEDYDFVLSVFTLCETITAIDNPFYSYRHGREGSITQGSNIKMIMGIEYTINKWVEKSGDIKSGLIKKDVLNYIAFIYSTGFVVCGNMSRNKRKEALKIMNKYKSVLKNAYWIKPRIARVAIKFMGTELFSILAAKYFAATHL